MSNDRTERLINLVLCLLSQHQFHTVEKIAQTVPGYEHNVDDPKAHEAFQRKFERDKAELRRLGIPLESRTDASIDWEKGYRIPRGDFELPEIALTAEEAAVVATAAKMWREPQLQTGAQSALWKLRASGLDIDMTEPSAVRPQIMAEEAFAPIMDAIEARRVVKFDYLGRRDEEPQRRTVHPYSCASWRGHWYMVGFDVDRGAERCFRLSRVRGKVRHTGPAGGYEIPSEVDALAYLSDIDPPPTAPQRAKLLIRPRAAWGVRRRADLMGPRTKDGDEVHLPFHDVERTATWLASFGSDVVVCAPPELVKATMTVLHGIADSYPGEDR
ncbi:helix-turn-helix transcriptional regulator [Natronoglycomyces albus]|uniref:WYL domain-containing protein n=1 Tax=Natronoglycomyces albus TaxID=2811108 RepID=A0A895XTV5_9ACTN|nr:WYL domain-containing protein [Natronoglycomyces albus]QSB06755.1 WYL domain-containing protein [Natronoglycomyces albus]